LISAGRLGMFRGVGNQPAKATRGRKNNGAAPLLVLARGMRPMNIQQTAVDLDSLEPLAALGLQSPSPAFLAQLPIAIHACDAEGRILWFNSRAADLWGRA
jgi:hypothetical protein